MLSCNAHKTWTADISFQRREVMMESQDCHTKCQTHTDISSMVIFPVQSGSTGTKKNSHQRIVDSNGAGETTDESDVEFKFYWDTNDKHRYLSIHVFLQNGSVDTCQSELVSWIIRQSFHNTRTIPL